MTTGLVHQIYDELVWSINQRHAARYQGCAECSQTPWIYRGSDPLLIATLICSECRWYTIAMEAHET